MFNSQIKNYIQVCAREDQPNIVYIVVLHGFKWISNTLPHEYQYLPHEYQYPIRNQMSWSNTNAPTPTQVCRERNKMADELANNCFDKFFQRQFRNEKFVRVFVMVSFSWRRVSSWEDKEI